MEYLSVLARSRPSEAAADVERQAGSNIQLHTLLPLSPGADSVSQPVPSRPLSVLNNYWETMTTMLTLLLIIALIASIGALSGFLSIIIGHSILRATHHAGYDVPLSSSMKVGAEGGAIVTLAFITCLPLWLQLGYQENKMQRAILRLINAAFSVAMSAASCALGVVLLHRHAPQVLTLSITHATRAGALGAAILVSLTALQSLVILTSICLGPFCMV
ncbi:hypothetical protein BU15DRAFT_59893 [Melanogaster broomeanus]|nr:hypothetical protein BU15DRAFT_59893 [Melanogaster broomeanus]